MADRPPSRFNGLRARRRGAAKPAKRLVGVDALVRKVLDGLGYNPARYAVFEVWDRLLGPQASKVRAVGLRGDRLLVEADSSAHMHDFMLRKRALLKKLNDHFGTDAPVSDIIIELAPSRRSREAR